MAGERAFELEALIIEALPNGTYRAELSNGHRFLAFVTGRDRSQAGPWQLGSKVRVRLSPCDLSQGRILVEKRMKI